MAARPAIRRLRERPAETCPAPPGRSRPDARRRRSGSTGTSGRRSTSCSACRATPARPTTCRRRIGQWLPRERRRPCRPTIARRFERAVRERGLHPRPGDRRRPAGRSGPPRTSSTSSPATSLQGRPLRALHRRPPRRSAARPGSSSGRSTATSGAAGDRRARWPSCEARGAASTLLREPERAIGGSSTVLEALAGDVQPIEPRVADILERDYDARAADRETLAPVDLIERTTGGIRWLPEAGIRRVILAPSYFSRPYNFLMSRRDWRFFGYPVSDDALEASRPAGAAAVGRAPPPGARRRDAPPDPEAARRAGPLPHRDRPAARPLQADDQAPPGPAPVRGPRDDHGVRDRHLLLASAATVSTTHRRRSSSSSSDRRDAHALAVCGSRCRRGPFPGPRVR